MTPGSSQSVPVCKWKSWSRGALRGAASHSSDIRPKRYASCNDGSASVAMLIFFFTFVRLCHNKVVPWIANAFIVSLPNMFPLPNWMKL
jgi:hypothetical protein